MYHNCSLHPCPASSIAYDQSDVELDFAAQAVHVCEKCEQWDSAGLVSIDTEIHIIGLDDQRPTIAVCHACAATVLERKN